MHMPTLENAASRSIGEQLRIGDGKTQWTIRFAQRRPEAVDVTVHEKGRRVEAMREEGAVLEIDSPAFVGIVEDAWGKIAQDFGERLVAGAAARLKTGLSSNWQSDLAMKLPTYGWTDETICLGIPGARMAFEIDADE
jgi:hypothetical protein